MKTKNGFAFDVVNRISEVIENVEKKSNSADYKKNIKAILTSSLSKLELVTQEEFEVYASMLVKLREKIDLLEKRILEIEEKKTP